MSGTPGARTALAPTIGASEMGGRRRHGLILIAPALIALAACQNSLPLIGNRGAAGTSGGSAPSSVQLVDRDVEAPEVFQATDDGLWDGRPSLGGVWVAHPEVKDPERVIIRNTKTDAFVIGALFRRERDMPGPRIQVSSDAAGALGMLAGQPANLQITALRREEAAPEAAPAATGTETDATVAAAETPARPTTPPASAGPASGASTAASAMSTLAATAPRTPAPAAGATSGAAATAPVAGALKRAYVQIGIFSVEANAGRARKQMQDAGLTAETRRDESQGKTFWRVVTGPFASEADRSAAIAKVKSLGYPDAYAVSR
ncbi:SPOR domain-containing protein [Frigidibacter sp. MR17.24]|uniref:SPOR domain-containing protein n=1 Tax=Frigidibacter sp. MR17.24 TaxID=3127345 RepID=UPI0030131DAE